MRKAPIKVTVATTQFLSKRFDISPPNWGRVRRYICVQNFALNIFVLHFLTDDVFGLICVAEHGADVPVI